MNSSKELGHTGENLVRDYLIRRGFEILNMNYHTPEGEIDIIAKENRNLRFVEVKTRRTKISRAGEASESLHLLKHQRLEKAMYRFLESYPEVVENYSLDAAIVEIHPSKARIIYYPNAFEAIHEA